MIDQPSITKLLEQLQHTLPVASIDRQRQHACAVMAIGSLAEGESSYWLPLTICQLYVFAVDTAMDNLSLSDAQALYQALLYPQSKVELRTTSTGIQPLLIYLNELLDRDSKQDFYLANQRLLQAMLIETSWRTNPQSSPLNLAQYLKVRKVSVGLELYITLYSCLRRTPLNHKLQAVLDRTSIACRLLNDLATGDRDQREGIKNALVFQDKSLFSKILQDTLDRSYNQLEQLKKADQATVNLIKRTLKLAEVFYQGRDYEPGLSLQVED